MSADTSAPLLTTPLHALHIELGAKMVPFGGYDMPVQYATGILSEHKHTRTAAGLFDVSHMGQVLLKGAGADAALETLVLPSLSALPERLTPRSNHVDAVRACPFGGLARRVAAQSLSSEDHGAGPGRPSAMFASPLA